MNGIGKGQALAHLAPADIVALLKREIVLMAAVFCVLFGLGFVAAISMPATYTANASLLMQLNKDYVYDPLAGDKAAGAIATIDQVVQSEVEILNSQELKKRVVHKVGYKIVLSKAPKFWNPRTPKDIEAADVAAVKVLTAGLGTASAPQSNVVKLSFKHDNAMSAALILNSLIDEYQGYRLEVYSDAVGPALQKQKDSFDQKLTDIDNQYRDFLTANGVGDFDTARATYTKVYDQVTADLFTTRSQMATDRAKLAEINGSLGGLSPEMSVERNLDLSIPSRILALRQQRSEMLARYLPDAQPIKDLDAQIASLQALMTSGSGIGEKDHKMGANPIYQSQVTAKMAIEAELASLGGREAQLQAQADEVTKKLQSMLGIEAQYNTMSAERDALQLNIKAFARRIQENAAEQDMTRRAEDAVRVVEKASLPDKPKSLKRIVLILAFLFAASTALGAGLLRVYTRKGFASADMAGKALDLPVLAQAPVKVA
ncbi:MAG: lipopolysaccharide biosynthesis protein [Asticcacaulis sp.]|nr:lipopolysaccharide biosynthesis protein [Asticcacaulis sp.]